MLPNQNHPPESIAILRLSAIGDVCHMIPVVRTLQHAYPRCQLTWIIGTKESELVDDLSGIEFIRFNKAAGWRSYLDLRRSLHSRRFDLLMHFQNSWRANGVSLCIPAKVRLGFAPEQTHDAQWWFTNCRIPNTGRRHILDMFFAFPEYLGIKDRILKWDIPISASNQAWANELIPDDTPVMILSPCSNPRFRNYRNWRSDHYGVIARYAQERHGLRIIITGGASDVETRYAQAIRRMVPDALDLTGQTGLKELLALLARASFLLCPDSGPAHMATAVGTPVIGLFATTNPDRARPYFSGEWCVNRYPEALQRYVGKTVSEVPWGTRVRHPEAMNLITVDAVSAMIDHLMATKHTPSPESSSVSRPC
ncbi:MAG: glycosyltransferase family 9 protein [Gammaproteobacteria bacterium]